MSLRRWCTIHQTRCSNKTLNPSPSETVVLCLALAIGILKNDTVILPAIGDGLASSWIVSISPSFDSVFPHNAPGYATNSAGSFLSGFQLKRFKSHCNCRYLVLHLHILFIPTSILASTSSHLHSRTSCRSSPTISAAFHLFFGSMPSHFASLAPTAGTRIVVAFPSSFCLKDFFFNLILAETDKHFQNPPATVAIT